MINALIFFALLMILHYSLTILNINANALSLKFFINANTLIANENVVMIFKNEKFQMLKHSKGKISELGCRRCLELQIYVF